MADDGIQPAPRTKPTDSAIRVGSPGTAADVVMSSRFPPKPAKPAVEKPVEIKDPFREIIETVVFVIVLVFMLKTFLAEAFVIPTGSMATTLLGYHKDMTCHQCHIEYKFNVSSEVEGGADRRPVRDSRCPNCEYVNPVR